MYNLKDDWYKKQMSAASVRPLCSAGSKNIEQYRFIWLRSFHNPILVTLTKKNEDINLYGIRLNGAGGYKPGKIIQRTKVKLSLAELNEFKSYIEEINFWALKSEDQIFKEAIASSEELLVHADGAQWILEGATFSNAHSVDRWGVADSEINKASLFLLTKSKIDFNGPIY